MSANRHGCWVALVVMTAATAWAGSPADAGEIRVWPTATVAGDTIALGDIAELRGFTPEIADELQRVQIPASSQAGRQMLVRIDDVRKALGDAGANLSTITIYGSSRCTITRTRPIRAVVDRKPPTPKPTQADAPQDPAEPGKTPKHDRADETFSITLPTEAGDTASRPGAEEPVADTLDAYVRRYLCARVPDRQAKVEIRFSEASLKELQVHNLDARIQITPRDERWLGLVSLDVEMTGDSGATQRIPVVAEVWLVKKVVVARGTINRGQTIEERDVRLEDRRFTDASEIGVLSLAAVVGKESRQFLRPGEMLQAKGLVEKPLIKRGDQVTIWLRRNGMVLKTVGQAREAGALGDTIEVRRNGVKRKQDLIEAVVTGPGTVTVGEPRQVAGLFTE